ncbi:Peptide-methionine (S)-S-oxide reductase MsrA [hydrothermal vent metagenome]|uniref:peptide-methionine (S)-S-oxide reductase n=1 Tax=hydrothermal vent metagenome TaxID=652676 RepID=A0A3B0XKC0_9ZZZZ
MFSSNKQLKLPAPDEALPGREQKMQLENRHFISGHVIKPPFGDGLSLMVFGLGCFWGAERIFWQQQGVYTTAVGYAAGFTPNPTYHEVCSGMTGHNEVVLVVYDEQACSTEQLVSLFFESHDPTQGMRQGNDQGTQYRSGIYFFTEQQKVIAENLFKQYQLQLKDAGHLDEQGTITTEIIAATEFYYAEGYHQQYLAKNPQGYCGLGGTGVTFNLE